MIINMQWPVCRTGLITNNAYNKLHDPERLKNASWRATHSLSIAHYYVNTTKPYHTHTPSNITQRDYRGPGCTKTLHRATGCTMSMHNIIHYACTQSTLKHYKGPQVYNVNTLYQLTCSMRHIVGNADIPTSTWEKETHARTHARTHTQ